MKKTRIVLSLIIVTILCTSLFSLSSPASADDGPTVEVFSPYYSEITTTQPDGSVLVQSIINGPSQPLPEYEEERLSSVRTEDQAEGVISNFPSYSWVFGCSAVSQAMIAAYHDRTGATNLYTGPTAGGVAPLTDTSWPRWTDRVGDQYPSNPIIASRIGTDGRTTKGSIEDYWVSLDSAAPDPYITGGWSEHSFNQAVGDFMFTSQSKYNNRDGSTGFWNFNDNRKLTCDRMETDKLIDGTLGRRNYYRARGYTVTDCYNQKVDSQVTGGFSLAQYKAEINAGRPVFLNLKGHSVVGYGYEGNTIYIRDTWSSDPNFRPTFQWGGSYQGMPLMSVSIVNFVKTPPPSAKRMAFPMIFKVHPQPIQNGDFEKGRTIWSEYSAKEWPLIVKQLAGTLKPSSGVYAAWLGGDHDEIARLSQSFYLPSSHKELAFNFFIASEESVCGNDVLNIYINTTKIATVNLCKKYNSTKWSLGKFNIESFRGQTIKLTFEVRTNGSLNSNFFLDDVRMLLNAQTLSEEDLMFEPVPLEGLTEPKTQFE